MANVVHRLLLAEVVYPDWHPNDGVGPVFGYAVATGDGVVLVDTGVGPVNGIIDGLYQPTRYDPGEALRAVGLAKDAVRAIVCSHLHFDHCGGNASFPNVPVWVQEAEREAATAPKYTIPEFVEDPGISYRLIAGDAEVARGVRIVSTPGHTPGHQCVAVAVDGGVELLATQAFETIAEFEAALADGSLDERYPGLAPLIPELVRVHVSHDERVWSRS